MRLLALLLVPPALYGTVLPRTFMEFRPGQFRTSALIVGPSATVTAPAGVRMRFEGARAVPGTGTAPLTAIGNIFSGNRPSEWRTGLPLYSRLTYENLYPGVSLDFYGSGGALEFDLRIDPHASLSSFLMVFDNAPPLTIDTTGTLRAGGLHLAAPDIGHYVIRSPNSATIEVAGRDPEQPLVIDPKILYSTYLGGNNLDQGNAIALDPAGNMYMAGATLSNNKLSGGGVQVNSGGSLDAFIAKLTPAGDALVYITYFGGNADDSALAAVADASGNLYVTGQTASTTFPLLKPLQPAFHGGSGVTDAFLTKFGPTGAVVFSTYLGGSGNEFGRGIALDSGGNIYIGGETSSTDFPVVNPIQPARGARDGFIAKITPAGDKIVYATYLGGTGFDSVNAIAVDSSGAAYVAGQTRSSDFPTTTGAFQEAPGGTNDGFIAKISPTGDRFVYATYFGSTGNDGLNGIAVDSSGNASVTGTTDTGIPNKAGKVTFVSSGTEVIAAKLKADGSDFVFEKLYGGMNDETGTAVAVDSAGNTYVAGLTNSPNFPLAGSPPQASFGGVQDGFVMKLDPAGAIVYSTYLGGSQSDAANGIAVDSMGNAYVTGVTMSSNFPTQTPLFATPGDTQALGDAFITKIGDASTAPSVTVTPQTVTLGPGATQQFTTNVAVTWAILSSGFYADPSQGTISATGLYTAPATIATASTVTIKAYSTADSTKSASATVNLTPPVAITLTVTPTTATLGPGATQQFTASVPVTWSIIPNTGSISATGLYTAPATINTASTVTVAATSTADPTKVATATVSLIPPAVVNVTVTPATATLGPGASQQFTANIPVLWSITPNTGTISATGLYTAPATIAAASTVNVKATSTADATKSGSATISLTPPFAAVTTTSVGSAASYSADAVSPGEIVIIFGASIGPATITTLQLTADGSVSTTLAQTRILFDDVPAPLIYVSSGQSSAVVPYSVDGKKSTQMVVEYQGQRSAPRTVPVAATVPAIFTADASGRGQGAILNQDNSVNGASNPAAAESIIIIYATGEGQTNPPGSDGAVATKVFPAPKLPSSVNIGGKNAEVLYLGAAPNFVSGVLQVNVKLPPGVTGNAVPVTINIGGINSQPGVTVAVQ